jgi:hypothetical protein
MGILINPKSNAKSSDETKVDTSQRRVAGYRIITQTKAFLP